MDSSTVTGIAQRHAQGCLTSTSRELSTDAACEVPGQRVVGFRLCGIRSRSADRMTDARGDVSVH